VIPVTSTRPSQFTSIEAPDTPQLPIRRNARGYYTHHSIFRFFVEIPQLFPFIIETSEEWLRPAGINLKKDKSLHSVDPYAPLLPPRDHTDQLIAFYLDHFELVHRIVHIPTFKQDYEASWTCANPDTTALIMGMMALSVTADTPLTSLYRNMPAQWLSHCDDWIQTKSIKRRSVVYYQVRCLLYLGKRMSMTHKKRYWAETGSLVQDAILAGLHLDSDDAPFEREMRRRIWCVIRELDLQNAYEHGLPSLLYTLRSDVLPPENSNSPSDNDVYQPLGEQTWSLRLGIARRLNEGFDVIPYDEVSQYTHQLVQAIPRDSSSIPTLFAQLQLSTAILALHRPYLLTHRLSENISRSTATDTLHQINQMSPAQRPLIHLREDSLISALTLTRIALHDLMVDPRASEVLEKALSILNDRFKSCPDLEPWGLLSLDAAISLIKIHRGEESRTTAKSRSAQRFLEVYRARGNGVEGWSDIRVAANTDMAFDVSLHGRSDGHS
jgi:hypothetical protein